MKKIHAFLLASIAAVGFCGCDGAPSCDDGIVKETLTEIYNEHLPQSKDSKISYEAFITEFKDDKIKKVGCKAKVNFSPALDGESGEFIGYEAQLTDDGKLYIELDSTLIKSKQFDDIFDEAAKEVEKGLDKLIEEEERRNRW